MFSNTEPKLVTLTPLEQRVLNLMRGLGPFDRLEIRVDKQKEIVIEFKSTLRETFPIDHRK